MADNEADIVVVPRADYFLFAVTGLWIICLGCQAKYKIRIEIAYNVGVCPKCGKKCHIEFK